RSRKIFLGDQQVRLLKHANRHVPEFLLAVDLEDPFTEGPIRLFEYEREPDLFRKGFVVVPTNHERFRREDSVRAEQFIQVDFVRTLKDRIGIVNDRESKRFRLLRKLERVMVHVSGLPYKQRVKLDKRFKIVAGDKLAIEPRPFGGFYKLLNRLLIRWRIRIVGVDQNGQVVFLFFRFQASFTAEKLFEG